MLRQESSRLRVQVPHPPLINILNGGLDQLVDHGLNSINLKYSESYQPTLGWEEG